ncbi:hypothetical protein Ssi03_67630 [Sphaerisporangium siamense]|uniref:Anti-sigma regulatory factor (Ser/Thr protein kinase) n=1 Tax=Sphaerisporangium siamense TaxID=795645 RepID=A0A7W7D5K5_9ACTN|nr:ATP-binding protein [Sphaerisporangium siamense]MBB4700724.1 anti-sigma regulatory factor (Ser/Thr protein kinase) [Sphaerisporangium siamense]GII88773.1 hypothetical protein Ssi03_67630 [Sphaerisporangium siamense]
MNESWTLASEPVSVGTARELTRKTLTGWGLFHVVDDVELVISELVTNALIHGSGPVTMALHHAGPAIIGAVSDGGGARLHVRDAEPEETGGRGLSIVQALAASWGIWPDADGMGKTVWFSFGTDRR